MLILFILVYLAGTLAIGFWVSRKVKTTQDFVVAGRKMPMLVVASALFATWFGSETIMGASSEFVKHGVLGVIEDPFGAALCLFLVGVFFARPLYRLNLLTFCDYYRQRFDRRTELVAALFMIPSYFGWIAAQLLAMAIILQVIAGVPIYAGIAICATVVVIYTYMGGMWAVSVTDAVQSVFIIGGMLWLLIDVTATADTGAVNVWGELPDGFFRFWPENDLHAILHYIAAWITIGLGAIPQQDIFQRVMSARTERAAVNGSYLASALYLSIAFIPLVISVYARALYPELLEGDTQMVLPSLVLQHGGTALQVMFFGALLSAILSTTSGAILAPATILGENVIRPHIRHINDRMLLRIMRTAVVLIAVITSVLASWKASIFELVAQSAALSLVSMFVPLTAGLWWRRASRTGAMCSILGGMLTWILAEVAGTEIPSLIYGLAASTTGMLVGSLLRPDKKDPGPYMA